MDTTPEPSKPRRAPAWLRTALIVTPAVAFVLLLAAGIFNRGTALEPGDEAPGFSGPLLGGGELALADLEGKPVVLNFWASWCEPCADEAPMLKSALGRYGERVAFVGINIKDARSAATRFVQEHGLSYPHVRDEGSRIYGDYGLTGQPETFLIDRDGDIFEHIPGPLFEDDLERLLAALTDDG